ncbi:hypothetical protein [Aquabacterium sp. NJ1]|uniref:hypothetical protein n=1 Tax=Aquabacterium sp. NJ1 TaxID=1538295 RepID=UPI00068A1313|nr:hypothetical protein [Aquabacterium sp. NJ1]
MELDGTTFVLEIINFLVLIWLLNRFLFRPIQAALQAKADREAMQARELAEQRAAVQASAQELKQQMADLAAQRVKAEAALSADMAALKQKRMQVLDTELQAERDKAKARAEQERMRLCDQSEQVMRQRTSAFVSAYMARLASPALEAAIIDVFLADLAAQSDQATLALRDGWAQSRSDAPVIDVSTAYPPSTVLCERVEAQLSALMGQAAKVVWREDPSLLSGICAHLPGHQLEASLRHGVDAFVQAPLDTPPVVAPA